jgi:hypothetical protein
MTAIAAMPVSLETSLELETQAHPADVLEDLETRVYIRVWREEDVVLKNGKCVVVTVRKWRVAGTWLEILREQQEALDDTDDYIRSPDLTGLRLLWGVPDAVLASIPDLEEEVQRKEEDLMLMEEEPRRRCTLAGCACRAHRPVADPRDIYMAALNDARTRLRAARRQVNVALNRWDRRRHAVAVFCSTL